MISPQNIAIGCSSKELAGKDAEILSRVAPYAAVYAVLMAVLIYVGTLLGL